MSNEWSDLDTKGYVVIPGFLQDEAAVDVLLKGFDQGRPPDKYPYGFKLLGNRQLRAAWRTIEPVLAEIRAVTSIHVDLLTSLTMSHYITTRLADRSSYLHQDFDLDYKLTRDHHNYLNFWISLRKPVRELSNVTLIPFDRLRLEAPNAFDTLIDGGGTRLVVRDGSTLIYGRHGSILAEDREPEPNMQLDFDIEEFAVTPYLESGDLLLMRGDAIHRTQDSDTERVAASIRVTSSRKTIRRESVELQTSGLDDGDEELRKMLVDCFGSFGRDHVALHEFLDYSESRRANAAKPA